MSSEDPIRQVPDELFRRVSAKPEREVPDALFGPALATAEIGSVSGAPETHDEVPSGTGETTRNSDTVENAEVDHPPPRPETDDRTSSAATVPEAQEPGFGAAERAVSKPHDLAVARVSRDGNAADRSAPGPDAGATVVAADSPGDDASAVVDGTATVDEGAPAATASTEFTTSETAFDKAASGKATSEEAVSDNAASGARPVLVVLADSLSYFGPKGGLPADDPRIWPNLVGAEMDWDVELIGRIGWTQRDAYWALIGDPRVWAAVPKAGAVVFAVGGMDTLPSPLPTALRELIRYIRPPGLRRVVRDCYTWLQPRLSKLGRPVALPPKVSLDYLERSRASLNYLRPDLPILAVLPSVHNSEAYGGVHSGRAPAVDALRAWSSRTSVPLVDLGAAVREDIFSGDANPDGIHWGWAGHVAVANAMVKTLHEVR